MLGTELPCEPPLPGGLPFLCGPPLLDTGVALGVRLPSVGAGLAAVVGDGRGAALGVGIGDGADIGVGVDAQLQETLTEFTGPLKVIVPFAGQAMLEGTVMATEMCPLG